MNKSRLQKTLSGESEPECSDSEVSEMDSHLMDTQCPDNTWKPGAETPSELCSEPSTTFIVRKEPDEPPKWSKKDFENPTWAKKILKKLSALTDRVNDFSTDVNTLRGSCEKAENFKKEIDDNFTVVLENLEEKFSDQIKLELSNSVETLKKKFVAKEKFELRQKDLDKILENIAPKSELDKLSNLIKNKKPSSGNIKPTLLPWDYKSIGIDAVKPNVLKNLETLNLPVTKMGLISIFEFHTTGFDLPSHRWIRHVMSADSDEKQIQEMCFTRLFWLLNNIITQLGHVTFFDKQKFKFTFKMVAKIGVTMKADHVKLFLKARTLYGSFSSYKTLGDITPELHDFLPPFFRKSAHRFFEKAKHKTWASLPLVNIRDTDMRQPKFRAAPCLRREIYHQVHIVMPRLTLFPARMKKNSYHTMIKITINPVRVILLNRKYRK